MAHYVYRCYSGDGSLLYVGCCTDIARRMREHRGTKRWHDDIAEITLDEYPDIAVALDSERAAIITERPRHNQIRYHTDAAVAWRHGLTLEPAASVSRTTITP